MQNIFLNFPHFDILGTMVKSPIENKELKTLLDSLPDDSRDIFLLAGGKVRMTLVSATHTVNQMKANHRTGLLETYVLGQAYIAGLLLTSCVKGDDRIQMTIECGGPIKGISIESWAVGAVRGYLVENPIRLDKPLETLDTSMLFGPGFLTISKVLEGSREPVSGTVMLEYGNIAKDLAVYFQESEQTPTLFYISLHFDRNGNVVGAGGLFIQAMPGCDEKTLEDLSERCGHLANLGQAVGERMTAEDYVRQQFGDFSPEKLESSFIAFSCPCTRQHFQDYLARLPQKEKDEILSGHFPLQLVCFNCGTVYTFTKSDVETLFKIGE